MAAGEGFVFVNKNARSPTLSRSTGQERRRIFSRAQTNLTVRLSQDFIVVTTREYSSKDASHHVRSRKQLRHNIPHPRFKELAVSDLDPFDSLSVSLDKDMQEMFVFYCKGVLPSIWWRDITGMARKNIMQCAAEDPAVTFALVGMANAVVAARTPDQKHTKGVVRCRYETVLHIREHLRTASKVRHSTVYAIALLLRLECGQGDLDAARTHFNGLITLLELLGFSIELPLTLLLSMQASMDHCSALFGKEPHVLATGHIHQSRLEDLLGDGSPTPGLDVLATRLRSTSSPLLDPPYAGFIGPVLYDITRKLHEIDLYHSLVLRKEVGLSEEQVKALFVARLSQQRRLQMSLVSQSRSWSESRAQEVVRLCLVLSHGPPVNISLPRTPFHSSLSRQLNAAITESLAPGVWDPCPDLLLWALTMAACISYEEDEWKWVLVHTTSACNALHIESLGQLRGHLVRFGFVPEYYTVLLGKIWNEIKLDREGRESDKYSPVVE